MLIRWLSLAGASFGLLLAGNDAVRTDELSLESTWDARKVEHLLNRAAFGGTREEIEAGVRLGPQALIDELFRARPDLDWVEPVLLRWEHFGLDHMQAPLMGTAFSQLSNSDQIAMCKNSKVLDREPFLATFERWFCSMVDRQDPLRDRMTLFWHGFFTTSWAVNKRKYELIHQFRWLRTNATGSYADLLRGIVADPAMLQYLDNTASSREHPNENLARELMELFSLGEGNYTEHDVREAARALTGAVCTSEGKYAFLEQVHDPGSKLILGERGEFGPAELVEILLRQPACARWVAGRLIEYFEGLPPSEPRLEAYAQLLRSNDYKLEPWLRRLFSDPEFYRDAVRGTRISAPIEHLAGICHKLGVHPASDFLARSTLLLGQSFYLPPNVKGWREGMAWISNDAMMRRGNCVGLIVGAFGATELNARVEVWRNRELGGGTEPEISTRDWKVIEADIAALSQRAREVFDLRRDLDPRGDWQPWDPSAGLFARVGELRIESLPSLVEHLLDDWLAIPVPPETQRATTRYLRECCAVAGTSEARLLADRSAFDAVLPKLAHFVFSLPEAQLR